jgi:hypothetical protein
LASFITLNRYLYGKVQDLSEGVRAQFNKMAAALARRCAADRGWSRRPGDGHLDTLLRAQGLAMQLK